MTEDEYIAAVIADAPPLSARQVAKLSALFDQDGPENRPESAPERRKAAPGGGHRRPSNPSPNESP
jgi:hypothetical protein